MQFLIDGYCILLLLLSVSLFPWYVKWIVHLGAEAWFAEKLKYQIRHFNSLPEIAVDEGEESSGIPVEGEGK